MSRVSPRGRADFRWFMRRILRKIAEGDIGNLGDTSTLADPAVVDQLVGGRQG